MRAREFTDHSQSELGEVGSASSKRFVILESIRNGFLEARWVVTNVSKCSMGRNDTTNAVNHDDLIASSMNMH